MSYNSDDDDVSWFKLIAAIVKVIALVIPLVVSCIEFVNNPQSNTTFSLPGDKQAQVQIVCDNYTRFWYLKVSSVTKVSKDTADISVSYWLSRDAEITNQQTVTVRSRNEFSLPGCDDHNVEVAKIWDGDTSNNNVTFRVHPGYKFIIAETHPLIPETVNSMLIPLTLAPIALFLVYLAIFWIIGSAVYDLLDKVIDRYILTNFAIPATGHFVIGLILVIPIVWVAGSLVGSILTHLPSPALYNWIKINLPFVTEESSFTWRLISTLSGLIGYYSEILFIKFGPKFKRK